MYLFHDAISALKKLTGQKILELDLHIELLEAQLEALRQERMKEVRLQLMQQGVIATDVDQLKASDGDSFTKRILRNNEEPRYAKAENGEIAYYCQNQGGNEGCGWVKGKPREEPYDNLSPGRGTSGIHKYCVICDALIQKVVLVRS
ncbi:MAG: hypothetical protein WCV85_01520 [Patescibacteria group bacterium]